MTPQILTFLKDAAKSNGPRIFTASAVSGVANALTIVIVTAAAQDYAQMNIRYLAMYLLCVGIYTITFKYAMSQTARDVRGRINQTNTTIAGKIKRADLRSFEKIDHNLIYTTLSENTEIIFEASRLVVSCASSTLMLLFSSLYLAFISQTAFWIATFLILCSAVGYLHNQKKIEKELILSSAKENEFFEMLDHLIDGFTEIKMHDARCTDILENYLKPISNELKALKLRTESKFLNNQIYAQSFWFLLIASIVFLLPQISSTPPKKVMSITMIVLFNLGPIATIVASVPIIVKANFAIFRLKSLEEKLDASADFEPTSPAEPFESTHAFQSIELRNLYFKYEDPMTAGGFSIGPIDLKIDANEIIFFVGGNGSGKTTLLKNIAGLYYPDRGNVLYNGMMVNQHNYDHYRNMMSAIFTEFHLFDRLYGLTDVDVEKVNALFRMMKLFDKTSYSEGKFSTINLSTGQRKRLAVINALMENRHVLIFDELAADQDPEFRNYFYEVLLKALKSEGKTIICSSHDDRYFHVADRIIKMEYGKIMSGA
ncbi:MAG: cyclic peptide export ABC transporter [Desulfatitalea sp.]|nr:cyclic peptide export ABC transporter [Desulfatitalea sp.]NNJ98979.1 cyclic peptide export ABC transporter [Desulfatitalea sp.]